MVIIMTNLKENCINTDSFPWDSPGAGLRRFFERSSSPMMLSDPESLRIIAANPAACSFYGYKAEEFASLTVCNITGLSREEALRSMELVKTNRQNTFESRHNMADGSMRFVELDAVPLGDDNSLFLTTVRDITARKEAEEELRRSEENFRTLAESTKDVIWTMSLDGAFTYVSPSVLELRGYTPEEVMEQTPEEALTEKSRKILIEGMQTIHQNIAAGKPMFAHGNRFELEQPCKDGSTVWTEATFSGIYDPSGRPAGIIGVTRDITEQKKARDALNAAMKELELETARRNRDAARLESEEKAGAVFLRRLLRDIRTIAHGMTGIAALLGESCLSDGQKLLAEALKRDGESLLDLLNNIRDLSNLGEGRLELEAAPFCLSGLLSGLREAYLPLADEKSEILTDIGPEVPAVLVGDRERLRQILANLAGNAVKFAPGGQVDIRVSAGERTPSGMTLLFSVGDTGPGIPKKNLPSLFKNADDLKDYFTNRQGRTGLGLAVTKGLVQLMNGWISVKSPAADDSEKPGTLFTFAVRLGLPAGDDGAAAGRRPAGRTPAVFDEESLLRACGGDRRSALEAAGGFLASAPLVVDRIRGAVFRGDFQETARQARALKNCAKRAGAPGLRAAAYEMQKETIAVKPNITPDLLEAILDELDRLTEALAGLLKGKGNFLKGGA